MTTRNTEGALIMPTKRPDHKALSLGEAKLKTSGLTKADAKKLKMSFHSGSQTRKLHTAFNELCSLKISYCGPDGKALKDSPHAKNFYRLRYLEQSTDFDAMAIKKPVRYVQEPNTVPVAYYPQNFGDWGSLIKNVDEPLIVTEGELKAAKACKEGFPTLGLGGVYNWRSTKLGITWLPSLESIQWVKRHVYLCFDSDYQTNPMVCAALRGFADELQRRGSFTYLVTLPQLPGLDKVGLDDFLVGAGPSSNDMFRELLRTAEPMGLAAPLFSLNERYCYIKNPGFLVDRDDPDNKISPSAFKEHLESTLNYQERQIKADGNISYKCTSASAAWLKWPLRTEAKRLTYEPGQKRFYKGMYNSWPGWGCSQKKGSVKLFLKLIDHVLTGVEDEGKAWLMRWLAYPLQHPGTKLFSSVVVHGIRHGTGKSLIGYTMGRIYGRNFTELSQLDIHNQFNEWAENKQFVLGDDVTGSNKRQDADFLKKMITQREIRLNPKHIRSYVVPDYINYYFTSNQPDAFFLDDDDRRYFIHEVLVAPLGDDFYREYDSWLDSGGSEAIFYYLANLDLKDFNPAAPAYRTAAKERMIDTGRSDLGSWVRQLKAVPDNVLKVGDIAIEKDLFTSKELLDLYDPIGKTGTTANGLARELNRAGFRQIQDGRPLRLSDGSQARYYAVRRQEHWLKQHGPSSSIKHLESLSGNDVLRKRKVKKY